MSWQPRITIIGAGFGGLGAAVELTRAGWTDVTILEKADGVGGVWRENTYPGAACDVPSSLYSWSFAPNPRWPHRYSRQPDILAYIERTARETGVHDLVRTGVEVASAAYDDQDRTWTLTTTTGETLVTDVLVTAMGQLSRPAVPDLPGRETFAGPAFHSAEWDHAIDLTGKRVAVLGTGASAIQFVPEIAERTAHVTVFQRSAPYVVPKPDREYTRLHTRAFDRFPRTQHLGREGVWRLTEAFNKALIEDTWLKKVVRTAWRAQLHRQVRDPELRAKLVPEDPFGCKRVLFSNAWYPALARPDVDVVTTGVTEVLPHGVRDADGTEHEADVIIYGTGFAATDFLAPLTVTGSGGADLREVWAEGAHAYLGMCVPGFPNLFMVYGPNTNLGGSSIITMLEAAAGAVTTLLRHADAAGDRAVEVRPEAEAAYDGEVQERLARSVWASCHNWYHQDGGRISTNWPGQVEEYLRRCAEIDTGDFVTS